MALTQLLILAAISALATLPSVLLIPRARQSLVFDRILWVATFALAFIGAMLALTYIVGISSAIDQLEMEQVQVVDAFVGALVGALSINSILWMIDRFDASSAEPDLADENPDADEEKNVGRD